MPTTAREENGNLIIDFGDGTDFTIYPVPVSVGVEIQQLFIGVGTGTTAFAHGADAQQDAAERIALLALGLPTKKFQRKKAPNRRQQELNNLRAERHAIVVQVATFWNCAGGGLPAVLDLLDEAGGFPKALERVMESCGLGDGFRAIKTLVDGGVPAPSSETDSTPSTTTPTGTASTSV